MSVRPEREIRTFVSGWRWKLRACPHWFRRPRLPSVRKMIAPGASDRCPRLVDAREQLARPLSAPGSRCHDRLEILDERFPLAMCRASRPSARRKGPRIRTEPHDPIDPPRQISQAESQCLLACPVLGRPWNRSCRNEADIARLNFFGSTRIRGTP